MAFFQHQVLGDEVDIDGKLPFVGETLRALLKETEGRTTLLGFVGAPWTLGAYAMEVSGICM
jgi:uroporphyrinogen decarboxylase